jgi:hypothetical protein
VLPEARFQGLRSVPAEPPDVVASDGVHADVLASDGGGCGGLARCLALLRSLSSTAVEDAALLSFREAADFAATVEELSRAAEYLQIVAAGAVDRTRREASIAARSVAVGTAVGWVTGWGVERGTETAVAGPTGWVSGKGGPIRPGADPADDGSRNTAEFLRTRLRISAAEARRRISLAEALLPRTGFTGHTGPAVRPELAAALAAGTIASRPATIITMALDRVRHHATDQVLARMEHALTRTAAGNDTDFLSRVARRWTDALDQDGTEPSEEELRRRQGVFLRRARRGLHHLDILATADQYETLLTVMNTATNPRTRPGPAKDSDADGDVNRDADADADGESTGAGPHTTADGRTFPEPGPGLDRRTRPQRLLDGLVGACRVSLTTGALPAAGGLRPQVMVTIDYRDLLDRLEHTTAQGPRYRTGTTAESPGSPDIPGTGTTATIPGTGSFTFTGPVTPATIRKIACDADIIPVLLGSEGRILDIGRTTRIFPPHIRKAITARDQGCAFPGCTIPAPWCEAHHITYWSHGGPTSTTNGTLLCSHHHHLIHKENWTIHVRTGIPWFKPPPHIDPHQQPQRNNYFRLE